MHRLDQPDSLLHSKNQRGEAGLTWTHEQSLLHSDRCVLPRAGRWCEAEQQILTWVYGDSLALVLGRGTLLLGVRLLSVRLLPYGKEALDVVWSRESWRPLYSVSLKTSVCWWFSLMFGLIVQLMFTCMFGFSLGEKTNYHLINKQSVGAMSGGVQKRKGGGVQRGLLGCLFYQDCCKAFNKHSTEGKLSNQTHREIKGYIRLNQAQRRRLDVSLLGNGNWFLAKVLYRSHSGWWILFETTVNLAIVYLRHEAIHTSQSPSSQNKLIRLSSQRALKRPVHDFMWFHTNPQMVSFTSVNRSSGEKTDAEVWQRCSQVSQLRPTEQLVFVRDYFWKECSESLIKISKLEFSGALF